MAKQVVVSVGTKRGLFLLRSNGGRKRWSIDGPLLKGWTVNYAMVDTRGKPRIHAAAQSFTFASNTLSGDIAGKKFEPATTPPAFPKLNAKAAEFVEKYGLDKADRLWVIAPGHEKEKKVLWAGTAPAGLFRSEDSGKSWAPVDGLNDHPTRADWSPGAGGQCLHSIQVDSADPKQMYVAISAAGSFRTDDGGANWKPINTCVAQYVGAPKESDVGT
jgi:hypothetical protein